MPDEPFRCHRLPGYRDIGQEDDTPRSIIESHVINDHGRFLNVHPAHAMCIGYQVSDEGVKVPTIRSDCALAPTALLYLPTVAELRAVGQSMIAMADEIEGEAAAAADAMWDKLRGGSGS